MIFYDLGLQPREADAIRSLCRVSFRTFNYNRYFPAERTKRIKLSACRWKPLIIAEVMKDHNSMWWMDTSVRWERDANTTLRDVIYPMVTRLLGSFILGVKLRTPESELLALAGKGLHSESTDSPTFILIPS